VQLLEWFDDFREASPKLALMSAVTIGLVIVLSCFMALPASPVMQAIGATDLQTRIRAGGQAAYWSYRVAVGRDALERPKTLYGTITGSTNSGMVLMSVPVGSSFQVVEVLMANLDKSSVNPQALWRVIEQVKNQNARVDVYPDGRSVIWIRGLPLNLSVIEAGAAMPETNPITNIVDKAFASYYWNVMWRGHSQRTPTSL